jgi:putative transposase
MCRALELSRSGFYAWRKRPASRHAATNRKLLVEIKAIHQKSRQTYGSPRIHADLQGKGIPCSCNRTARLMQQAGIRAVARRRYCHTTDSRHDYPVAPNILARNFTASGPDRVWLTDITYVPTEEGWLYLGVVMDLHSRRIIGWATSNRIDQNLTLDALRMALGRRQPAVGLLHHSDRGSQYAGYEYQKLLSNWGLTCSMSRKGEPYDNAAMESFFRTLKVELVYRYRFRYREEAKAALVEYIELFYNRERRHSALGYLSPAEFEKQRATA